MHLTFKSLSTDTLHDFLNYFDHDAFTDNPKWSGCYCQFYLDDPAVIDLQTISDERNRQSACDRVGSGAMAG